MDALACPSGAIAISIAVAPADLPIIASRSRFVIAKPGSLPRVSSLMFAPVAIPEPKIDVRATQGDTQIGVWSGPPVSGNLGASEG